MRNQLCKEEIMVDSVKAALERSMVMAAACSLESTLVLSSVAVVVIVFSFFFHVHCKNTVYRACAYIRVCKKGPPDPAFLLSFHNNPASRTCVKYLPNTVFFPNTTSRANILVNPASRVPVKSRVPSNKFCIFPSPHYI